MRDVLAILWNAIVAETIQALYSQIVSYLKYSKSCMISYLFVLKNRILIHIHNYTRKGIYFYELGYAHIHIIGWQSFLQLWLCFPITEMIRSALISSTYNLVHYPREAIQGLCLFTASCQLPYNYYTFSCISFSIYRNTVKNSLT